MIKLNLIDNSGKDYYTMPNWCHNDVTLSNENSELIDDLEQFLRRLSENPKSEFGILNYLYPLYTNIDDWDWDTSVDEWGTKWDVTDIKTWSRDGLSISMEFDSAWSPPIAFYDHISKPENGKWIVSAYYYEPGIRFAGKYVDGCDSECEYPESDSDEE